MGFNYSDLMSYYDYTPYRASEVYLSRKTRPRKKTKAKPKKATPKPRAKKLNLDKTIAELEAVLASAKTLLQVVKKMKRKEKS